MDSFQWMDATTQAELVAKKEVTPLELVDATIKRIENSNPKINAVITEMFDDARKIAMDSNLTGPFGGVPFLMKDLEFFAGARYTGGSRYLKDFVAQVDSELVGRIRKTGLITVGKTNTCEFGLLPVTEPELFGATRNPWNLEHTAGGSSGGAAAAVAAGIVPMAHASDGGGSIRIPASCCGLFGLKTTRGRNPRLPDVLGIGVSHCISRSVRDSAALLDLTSGSSLGSPFSIKKDEDTFVKHLQKDPGKLRIAYLPTALDGTSIHPDCVQAVEDAAILCEQLGHSVEKDSPSIDVPKFNQAFATIWQLSLASGLASLPNLIGRQPTEDDLEPFTWEMLQRGSKISGIDILQAQAYMQQVAHTLAQFYTQYDLFLTPTLSRPPVKVGEISYKGDVNEMSKQLNDWVPYTPLANTTGVPAMSVPLHWTDDGLPVGVHFMAPYGDEATLFRLAGQLEQARPWANRRPPLF